MTKPRKIRMIDNAEDLYDRIFSSSDSQDTVLLSCLEPYEVGTTVMHAYVTKLRILFAFVADFIPYFSFLFVHSFFRNENY